MRVPAFALRLALGEGLAEVLLTGQRAVPARLERAGFAFRYETLAPALEAIFAR
jgi:NAD dependent epimerase/dehydratase family enzyme